MTALANQRHLFDIPDDVAYFNCASRTPFLKSVVAAGDRGVRERVTPWTWDHKTVEAQVEAVRSLFAGLIGAAPNDIAICPAASYGLAVAARNLPLGRGQTVLFLEDQFPSNVFIWMEKAAAAGATVVTVPRPADGDWTAAVLARIDSKTAIAALPPCHWTDGGILDLQTIGAACRDAGAALVVDATQWAGAAPFDVARIKPDFVVVAAYKWLCCPNGMALMYVAPDRQDGVPLEHHDYNHPVTAASIEGRLVYDPGYSLGARRFDVGQTYNLVQMPMAEAALAQVAAWTPGAVAGTLKPMIDAIADDLAARGFRAPPLAHRAPHFIGLAGPVDPPKGLITALADTGVHASLRCGGLRIAPHVYVSENDVCRLSEALAKIWA
ncbi:MAG: aminotransferase class V-fold PLP-dependent enzyme [Rhodospirillaceae bacterium]